MSAVLPSFRTLQKRFQSLLVAARSMPFDPKFNAFHWVHDCWSLANQIEYGVGKMEERATEYMARVRPGDRPQNTDNLVTYFADNSVTRIMSFRDKLGLSFWSFFYPFNPYKDRLLTLAEVIKEFGRGYTRGQNTKQARDILRPLQDHWPPVLKRYRDLKIHRREPRIEIYGTAPHHDWRYLVPVNGAEEERLFRQRLAELYPDEDMRRDRDIEEGCVVRGQRYRALGPEENERLFGYSELLGALQRYRPVCYAVAAEAILFFRRRKPFRRNARR